MEFILVGGVGFVKRWMWVGFGVKGFGTYSETWKLESKDWKARRLPGKLKPEGRNSHVRVQRLMERGFGGVWFIHGIEIFYFTVFGNTRTVFEI